MEKAGFTVVHNKISNLVYTGAAYTRRFHLYIKMLNLLLHNTTYLAEW